MRAVRVVLHDPSALATARGARGLARRRWRHDRATDSRLRLRFHGGAALVNSSAAHNYDRQARLAKVTGSSHGSSDYQKQVVEHVLQKPFTTLEAYYDFWARMEDASKNDATFFFCVLAQKMLSADKRAATGADVALGVSGASVLGTMLQLVLYYPVQAEDKEMKALSKKLRQSSGRSTIDSLTVEALFEMVGKGTKRDTLVSFVERASSVDPPSTAGSPDRDPSAFAYGLLRLPAAVRAPARAGAADPQDAPRHPPPRPPAAHADARARAAPHAHSRDRRVPAVDRGGARRDAAGGGAAAALGAPRRRRRAGLPRAHRRRDPAARRECVARAPAGRRLARRRRRRRVLAPRPRRARRRDDGALRARRAGRLGARLPPLFLEAQPAAPPTEGVRAAIASMLFALFHNASPPLNIKPAKLAALPDAVVVQLAAQAMRLCRRPPTAAGWWRRACRRWRRSSRRRRRSTAARRRSRVTCSAPASPSSSTASSTATRSPQLRCAPCARLLSSLGSGLPVQPVRGRAARAADGGGGGGGGRAAAADDAAVHRGRRRHLQRVAQAYVVLRCAHPELCAAVRLLCYLVPIGRSNRLASYVAMRDGWYLRHVYAAHSGGHPTVPHLIVPAWEKTKPERSSSPGGSPEPPPRPPQAPSARRSTTTTAARARCCRSSSSRRAATSRRRAPPRRSRS